MEEKEEPGADFNILGFSEKLDIQYLNDFYGDDLERAVIMFGIFVRTVMPEVDQLKRAYSSQDLAEVSDIAHRIKPNFAMVGLSGETDRLNQVEHAADDADQQRVDQMLGEFFANFDADIALIQTELSRMEEKMSNS